MKFRFTWDESIIETKTMVINAQTKADAVKKFRAFTAGNSGDVVATEVLEAYDVKIEREKNENNREVRKSKTVR